VRRRLVSSTALIALASVIVLGVPLGIVEAARVRTDSTARLEREADAVASAIDDRLEAHQPLSAASLNRYVRPSHRVVVTTRDGTRLTVGSSFHGEAMRARAGSGQGASVVAEAPASEAGDRVRRAWLLIAALAVGGVAAAAALALIQARRLARPLESLAGSSTRLGEGDFSARAGRFSIPEVDALAHALDATAERITRLVAREREFSANASHQLRTPLTALRLRLEEIGLQASSEEERDEVAAALAEVDRLERTVADLLAYAREARAGEAVDLDLAALIRRHAETWSVLYERAGRRLDVDAGEPVPVHASPGALGQVLDVLLENALRHGAGRARISVADDPRRATVAVEDEGKGVSADMRESIFDRGESVGGGSGIGLHLARVLAVAEGGRLRVAPAALARFELVLPRGEAAAGSSINRPERAPRA
jgi:signal transduction histidine kinase